MRGEWTDAEALDHARRLRGAHGRVLRARTDLEPSSRFLSKQRAEERRRRLKNSLASRGYTVDGDRTVYRVYVIRLRADGMGDVGKGFVYVGETSKTPEERLREHLHPRGPDRRRVHSSIVSRRGLELIPRLAPKTVYFSRASAKAAEKRVAERLASRGYRVAGGH